MNIGIFAFGRAGCKIADEFKRFEYHSMIHISEFIFAADTAQRQLNELSHIDEDWQLLFGQRQFERRGSRGDLEGALEQSKRITGNIKQVVNNVSTRDIDAFLIIGSLGGGTGAAAAPLCAQILSQNYSKTPVYGVGILPANREANVYTLNAARSIQSFSSETDNLLLFDNDHLNIAMPASNPNVPDDADPDDVFDTVNQDIARCLHILFTADERSEKSRLEGSTADTDQLVRVLSAGGLSTMSYVTETLPRPARPGVTGRVWELIESFRIIHQRRKHRKNVAAQNADDTETGMNLDALFNEVRNGRVGIGPDANVESETTDAIVLHDDEIPTDSLSDSPFTGPEEEEATTGDAGGSTQPSFDRDWPHPTKLVPLTLDSNSAMMDVDPTRAARNMFLLIAPSQHLTQQAAITTTEWAEENTNSGYSVAKNYPMKHKKVGVLTLNSGIGIPERVRELQSNASQIAQDKQKHEKKQTEPKRFNVFEHEDTVPPSL